MRRLSSSSSANLPLASRLRIISKVAFVFGFLAVTACNRQSTAIAKPESSSSSAPLDGSEKSIALSREVKEVFDRCAKAIVKIEASDAHGDLSGTGFFVDPTGTLYTAYSVGGEADNINVEFKGK